MATRVSRVAQLPPTRVSVPLRGFSEWRPPPARAQAETVTGQAF